MLVTAGAVDSAITVAKKVVEKDPSSSQGWQARLILLLDLQLRQCTALRQLQYVTERL